MKMELYILKMTTNTLFGDFVNCTITDTYEYDFIADLNEGD